MVSDLTTGLRSTHDLLFRLLASETGLLGVAHASVQLEALHQAMPHLKSLALANLEKAAPVTVPGFEGALSVPGQADGLLFAELYRGMELFLGQGTLMDDYATQSVLQQWVYPLAGRRVEQTPALRSAWLTAFKSHQAEYGPVVSQRLQGTLAGPFRLTEAFIGELQAPAA